MTYREGLWSAPDIMASEYETFDLLYGLVRLSKPSLCFESGCYLGHGSEAINRALVKNRNGCLITCDTDLQMVQATLKRGLERTTA